MARGPAQRPLAKPKFDIVAGVSAGTVIAPFAFLGDGPTIDQMVTLYRDPEADWVQQRGMLYFLPDNMSISEVPGLERESAGTVTMDMVRRIAKAGANGRINGQCDQPRRRRAACVRPGRGSAAGRRLGRARAYSQHHVGLGGHPRRVPVPDHRPEALCGRRRDGEHPLWRADRRRGCPAGRLAAHLSSVPIPKIRFWIIFNNQFRPVPHVTPPKWMAVVQRSLETATRASTAIAVKDLVALAEIARLKRNADMEIRIVSIPGDWSAGTRVFVKETMNNLADLGERMGADPASWGDQLAGDFQA